MTTEPPKPPNTSDAAPTPDPVEESLLGGSPSIVTVRDLVRRVAPTANTVMLRGETGTGKEVVARAIHLASRPGQPFVKVHCAAFPDSLLESELFGYERGAFTGAATRKPGRLDLARGGTVFLDEIGDIAATVQVKLLRLLQDGEYERLGGTSTLRTQARFIVATHRDLEAMRNSGEFREDLFYRVNVCPIWLPPLRARRDDIAVLANCFLAEAAKSAGRGPLTFSLEALRRLRRERWQGNARELRNVVGQMVTFGSSDVISLGDVERALQPPPEFETEPGLELRADDGKGGLNSERMLAERDAIARALQRSNNNRALAARMLGISRRTLYYKLDRLKGGEGGGGEGDGGSDPDGGEEGKG